MKFPYPRPVRLAALVLGSMLFSAVALPAMAAEEIAATPAADVRVDRLTDAILHMLPLGDIFDRMISQDPAWPLGAEHKDKVSAESLACLRTELSSQGYRRSRRAEAEAYAAKNAARLDDDLKLLAQGAENLVNQAMSGGMQASIKGEEFDAEAALKKADAGEFLAFFTFLSDEKYAPLRELVGLGNAFDPSRSSEENEDAGKKMGTNIAAKAMFAGFAACDVSPATFF